MKEKDTMIIRKEWLNEVLNTLEILEEKAETNGESRVMCEILKTLKTNIEFKEQGLTKSLFYAIIRYKLKKGSVTMIKKEAITLIAQRKPAYVAVMKELEELRSFFYDDVELVSAETGEVFSMEEIDRVLAILDGIVNNQTWCPQFVKSKEE